MSARQYGDAGAMVASGALTFDGVAPATGRAVTIALNQDLMDDRYNEGSRILDTAVCSAP
ncbi:hypothetical protein F3087_01915 [Nocardia colli]|uniref:Uncharacterized protein n=1 Tax=Nocardia colli TaxID=2545717 RepID=A0A5N0EMI8_9NOCA|nr:hypothetical protein [Nocardia colli]KAA8890096.1 hypothetical protein F3087_01915 [Nocardia colli]